MHLADFDAILFDMDGTLYRERHALAGAAAVMARVQEIGRPFACVTNNSANTAGELAGRLAGMGIAVPPAAIYTSCHAMVDWMLGRFARPRVFNFAGGALPVELGERGQLIAGLDEPCDVVALGTHFRENAVGFDFERALVGLNVLTRQPGAQLVVGSADRVFPVQLASGRGASGGGNSGGVEFGSGSWGALFSYAANLAPERIHHVGKPSPEFFEPLLRRLGVTASRCLIVGDNLESDILGGRRAGMATALVLTGVAKRSDLATGSIHPDAVFDDLEALLAAMG